MARADAVEVRNNANRADIDRQNAARRTEADRLRNAAEERSKRRRLAELQGQIQELMAIPDNPAPATPPTTPAVNLEDKLKGLGSYKIGPKMDPK